MARSISVTQIETIPARSRKRTARRTAGLALLLAGVAGTASVLTAAVLTDSTPVPDNVFGGATMDLVVGPTAAAFNAPAMVPGDKVFAPLTVRNAGTAELRYAMRSMAPLDDQFGNNLTLDIVKGATTCDAAGFASGTTVGGSPTLWGFQTIFGSSATGAQAGDRVLAGGQSEVLCARVSMPITASGTEGKSTTVTFTFDAEQTANNP
jgi:hypothetical protein